MQSLQEYRTNQQKQILRERLAAKRNNDFLSALEKMMQKRD